MKLKTITKDEYSNLIEAMNRADFLQSVQQGNKMQGDGYEVEYFKAEENGELMVLAMLVIIPFGKIMRYCYIPRGFLCDYHDENRVVEFTFLLKNYLKKKNVVYMEIDPPIILKERDRNGDIVEGGIDNSDVVKILKDAGYEQLPLKKGYDSYRQCRFVSVLDLKGKSEDEVFSSFMPMTRHNIRNSLKNCVHVRLLERDEVHILKDLVDKSGQKQNFETLPLEFYEKKYEYFGNHVQSYEAYLNVKEYMQKTEEGIVKEEENIRRAKESLAENPHSRNSKHRLIIAQSNLESLHKRQKEAEEIAENYPEEVPLAAAMFIFYGRQVYYLASGSDEKYRSFKAPYALQWNIIQKAVREGYERYNFYGISGCFRPGEEGYGVFDFKRGFNAVVEEYIGNFILPVKPLMYRLCKTVKGTAGIR